MVEQVVHPQHEQLSAFALGKLDANEVGVLESHLAGCDSCCQAMKQIQEDTFVGLVRQSRTVGNTPADAVSGEAANIAEAAMIAPFTTEEEPSAAPSRLTVAQGAGDGKAPTSLPPELANHPRYRVQEVLGTGGMGTVYKAEHRLMQRPVALKVINAQWVASTSAVERFRREVQAAGQLHHPNIVTAHDAEQAGEVHFLAMEYVKGTDLGKVLNERGPLPVAEACDYIRQAALGLQHAMDNGMVHRDIKPQNLMLTPQGQVKILDFGLAFLTTEAISAGSVFSADTAPPPSGGGLTQVGSLMGTPDYMAPEQARDAHAADIRADVYSLGCTLYSLLTGQVPFPGGTAIDKIIAHSERKPQPISELRKDVPAGLVEIVNRMLAKDPAVRYQRPADVAEALAPFTMPTSHSAPSRSDRARRWRRIGIVAAGAALLLLGGIIYIATDNGRLVIDCKVDDVQVVVSKGGKQYEVMDLKSGSAVKRLPSGEYEIKLKGERTDVKLSKDGFTMTRGGQVLVNVTAEAPLAGKATRLKAFAATDATITGDGVTAEQGGWRIDAKEGRSVRLFELPNPGVEDGVVTYRARMKSEKVEGKAYLEMWCRVAGLGEFFSKGLQNPVQGTSDWASYEIPFFLKKGQKPDLLKLGVVLEEKGTLWIKDVEVHFAPSKTPVKAELENAAEIRRIEVLHALSGGVTVLPDGRRVLSASDDALRLWDLQTGKLLRRFEGGRGGTRRMGLSPDGRQALTGTNGGQVVLWDVENGREVRRFDGHTATVDALAFSPDGKQALSGAFDGTMRLWDVASGKELRRLDVGPQVQVFSVAFSPNGKHAISGSHMWLLQVWDLDTGKELRRFAGHNHWVLSVVISPDGRLALSGSSDGSVRLWEMATGKQLRQFIHLKPGVESVAFARDGRRALSTGDDKMVRLWDVETGQELARLEGHTTSGVSVDFTPDGRHAVSGGADATIRMWRLPAPVPEKVGEVRRFDGHEGPVRSVVFSADGRRALSGSGWPNGDSSMRLWDVESGQQLRRFQGDGMVGVTQVALSRDGRRALSGSMDRVMRLWDVDSGKLLRRFEGARVVAFSPDGSRALSDGKDNVFRLWDLESGKEIGTFAGHTAPVHSLAFSPDGKHVVSGSGGLDQTVRLWDAASFKELNRFEGHQASVVCVAFSPDGRLIVSCGDDTMIRLWDVQSGKELRSLAGHTDNVHGAAFTADGRRVLSGSRDRTVRLWDVESGKELHRFEGHQEWVWSVACSPDGRHAVSGGGGFSKGGQASAGGDWAIRLWRLPEAAPAAAPLAAKERP